MRSRIASGVALAAAAAVAFGATAPVIARYGLHPWSTAALLYIGAAASTLPVRGKGERLRRTDARTVLIVAILGGALAPALFAWGLQRTGATVGALMLNLEAMFTVLLAREALGRRVVVAIAAMVLGGAALGLDLATRATFAPLGAAAIAAATLAWALDNTLTRPLAEREPTDVVAAKGAIGAAITGAIALATEPTPTATTALILLACGATGYGASLRLYLLAQRRIGAARTGSVFALAPFVGAALALGLGDRVAGPWTAIAAVLYAIGVWLHATERLRHEHLHRHDDGAHDHAHDPPFRGEHSHAHTH